MSADQDNVHTSSRVIQEFGNCFVNVFVLDKVIIIQYQDKPFFNQIQFVDQAPCQS